MKVVFVLPPVNLSGGIRVIATFADQLQQRGWQVQLVSPPSRPPSLREQFRSLRRRQGWIVTPRRPPSHLDQVNVPHRVLERYRPVRDADVPDADVVVATWWETAEWVAPLSSAKGAKAYFVQGHEIFDYLHKERVAATYHLPLHKIVVSQWLVEVMRQQYGDHQVSLVGQGVDMAQFHASPRDRQIPPAVGMLYSPAPVKDWVTGMQALALARRQIPGLRLVAFGAEKPTPACPLPPGTEFHLLPEQQRIKDIYASCDVWLCSSRSEGFHLPIGEALACRCPVVSTRVGGAIDLIEEGVNGCLAPVGDAAALAGHLVRVLTQPEAAWRAMSDAAHQAAIRHTWDAAATRFEAALHQAIARQQRRDFTL